MNPVLSLLAIALIYASSTYCLPVSAVGRIDPVNEVVEPKGNFPSSQFVKIAVLQWSPRESSPLNATQEQAEAFKAVNRKELAQWIKIAAQKGAELVITPEFGIVSYPDVPDLPSSQDNFRNREDVAPYVETVPGPSTQYFGELSKRLGIYVQVGFVEIDVETQNYYNVVVVMGPQGQLVAKHRKINFYGNEGDFLSPGTSGTIFEGPMGRVGLMVCADIYHSPLVEFYKKQKLDVVLNSASWAAPNTAINYFASGARSMSSYLAASNMTYAPDAAVLYPDGRIQAHIRQSSGLAYGYVPRKHPK